MSLPLARLNIIFRYNAVFICVNGINEEKARTIASHGSFIFVSDEIYQSREFLKNNEQVFSVKDLNIETLKKIGSRQF